MDEPTSNHRKTPRSSTLSIARFVVATVLALAGLFYLLHRPAVVHWFVDPYTSFVAAVSRGCLRLIGVDAGGSGSMIASPEFAVSIKNVCNGLEVTAIFLAVTLAFPANWKSKLIGVALGYPVIFVINIVRIMVLFVLGFKVPDIFDAVHYYYAQAFVIIATVAVWLLWVSRFSGYGAAPRPRVSD